MIIRIAGLLLLVMLAGCSTVSGWFSGDKTGKGQQSWLNSSRLPRLIYAGIKKSVRAAIIFCSLP
ncbi:MAG: hypothetical protein IPP36_08215 [Nitrosomonadales bacterium]|nr:hypothetical protein [Nitrosomonadales bacterium]